MYLISLFMEKLDSFKKLLVRKYGSVQYGKAIILARRKRYHMKIWSSWLELVWKNPDFAQYPLSTISHKQANRSWRALRLIDNLIEKGGASC